MQCEQYSTEFIAKVALEAIKGFKTPNELAVEHGIHPDQIQQWKNLGLILFKSRQSKSGWALPPESLMWIARFIQQQQIKSVVECGSGLSTLIFACLDLEQVLTLEHSLEYYNDTYQKLIDQNLLEYVSLVYLPLKEEKWNDKIIPWYDVSRVSPFSADFIFVDGPPGNLSSFSRYPALAGLREFIRSGTWILLDDCYRSEEAEIVKLWVQENPSLRLVQTYPFKHGLALFQYVD